MINGLKLISFRKNDSPSFPVILYEKSVFWVTVCLVISAEVAVMWFGHFTKIASLPRVHHRDFFCLLMLNVQIAKYFSYLVSSAQSG